MHVFVEGPSDEDLIGGLIDAIWGEHRALGIRITPLHGIDKLARHRALVEAFSTYARKALLIADDEGKIERDLRQLRDDGLLVEDDSFWSWKRNIEEDSSTPEELVAIADAIAALKGKSLGLTVAKLNRIRETSGVKKGLATRIVDFAEQKGAQVTKREIATALRDRILAELQTESHESRRQRAAESDEEHGRRVLPYLGAGWAENRLHERPSRR